MTSSHAAPHYITMTSSHTSYTIRTSDGFPGDGDVINQEVVTRVKAYARDVVAPAVGQLEADASLHV